MIEEDFSDMFTHQLNIISVVIYLMRVSTYS